MNTPSAARLVRTALVVTSLTLSLGCGRKFEQSTLAVGQTVVVAPMSAEAAAKASRPSNIRLVVELDTTASALPDDVEILMYGREGDRAPLYVYTAKDLRRMHLTTGCSAELRQYVEQGAATTAAAGASTAAVEGDTVFCNDSLDLSKVGYFVARRPGRDDKSATSAMLEFTEPAQRFASFTLAFN